MIARLWHGWTTQANGELYERLLLDEVLPGIRRVPGYHGGYALRRSVSEESEYVTLTLFASLDAVRAFAGEDYGMAVVPAEARKLLVRLEERPPHFETALRAGRGPGRIARLWHGAVPQEKAEDYLRYLQQSSLPDLHASRGNRGVLVLRRTIDEGSHYLVMSLWDSWEAIRLFAGDDPEKARYFPQDAAFLLDMEPAVTHYEVLQSPESR